MFCLRYCGILENSESVVPAESGDVCSVFVCKVAQDKKPNRFACFCAVKTSIVTSNMLSLSFLTQGDPLWSRIGFLECMIISMSWLVILVCYLARWIALVSSSSDMEG